MSGTCHVCGESAPDTDICAECQAAGRDLLTPTTGPCEFCDAPFLPMPPCESCGAPAVPWTLCDDCEAEAAQLWARSRPVSPPPAAARWAALDAVATAFRAIGMALPGAAVAEAFHGHKGVSVVLVLVALVVWTTGVVIGQAPGGAR